MPRRKALSTTTPSTMPVVLSFPRLPMLIPCPGPHRIFFILMLELPFTMDTQSSPVPILHFSRTTLVDSVMCIPSVLGLSPGADTFTPTTRTESQRPITKFICCPFWMLIPFTPTPELESIVRACIMIQTYNHISIPPFHSIVNPIFIPSPLAHSCRADHTTPRI